MALSKPWQTFKVGKKSEKSNWINTSCQSLETLYHVAHLETADRIFKDKICRAGLIYDKSILNTDRLLVNWLSPNTWAYGSRYGNIGFEMNFANLVEGKQYYWVESINYKPEACRILITEYDYDDDDRLTSYNPKNGDGPWFLDEEGNHYWNGNYTLEFMFEDDILLSKFSSLQIFSHHDSYCNINPENCDDKSLSTIYARERFIAGIMANDLPVQKHFFGEKKRGKFVPNRLLIDAIETISRRCVKLKFEEGFVKKDDDLAAVLLQSVLLQIRHGCIDEAKKLIGLFYDSEHYEDTLVNFAVKKFSLSSGDQLLDR